MRKIISILVALGLILGLSVMAVPTAAQACATVSVFDGTICAGTTDTFNITTTAPVTLLPVNDKLSVEFGAGTTFGTFLTGDIKVNGYNVTVTQVEQSGTRLFFPIPAAAGVITAGSPIEIIVAKVTNPATAGTYDLKLNYKLSCCDPVVWCTVKYTVVPAQSTYGFFWDSGPTYPGISPDFVPPFKACGQNTTGAYEFEAGKFANAFNLILKPTLIGCAGPCASDVVITLKVSAAPAGSKISLGLNNTGAITHNLTTAANGTLPAEITVGNATLGANTTLTWNNIIHFDTVGLYTICVKAWCPPGAAVCPNCDPKGFTVAERCFNITVYQWKDAAKLTLNEKWNLISLPLVPLVGDGKIAIADALASIPSTDRADIVSIWYYDRCTDKWSVWPTPGTGQLALTTLEAGKAYWLRTKYPQTDCGNITWWVWGTEKPMPPAAPAEYPVCKGWNMFGFLSTENMPVEEYLWNWGTPFPAVYGWGGGLCWTAQDWQLILSGNNLTVGQGYWGAFPVAGSIYVP